MHESNDLRQYCFDCSVSSACSYSRLMLENNEVLTHSSKVDIGNEIIIKFLRKLDDENDAKGKLHHNRTTNSDITLENYTRLLPPRPMSISLEAFLDNLLQKSTYVFDDSVISGKEGLVNMKENEEIDYFQAISLLYSNSSILPSSDIKSITCNDFTPLCPFHPNLVDIYQLFEDATGRYIIFKYYECDLDSIMKFNMHMLYRKNNDDTPLRFIFYQMLNAISFVHSKGLVHGNISPTSFFFTEHLWLRLGCFNLDNKNDECDKPEEEAAIRWSNGKLSNFDYLMILNAAAGRKMKDGTFHPVMPWVTNFTIPYGGWRDLTKSKFRLNKGDYQLDITYNNSIPPHHIPESLSEITYYMYMSRRTPKEVLKKIVRSNFQAKEYPSTMVRMFEWTPDECIPEFYYNEHVFKSRHADMSDIELPSWCSTPREFILYHRELLESDRVSAYLHHWIDLNFGYKLSGEAAIEAKNVSLQASEISNNELVKRPGFVQLFKYKHPPRKSVSYYEIPEISRERKTEEKINNNRNMNIPEFKQRVLIKKDHLGANDSGNMTRRKSGRISETVVPKDNSIFKFNLMQTGVLKINNVMKSDINFVQSSSSVLSHNTAESSSSSIEINENQKANFAFTPSQDLSNQYLDGIDRELLMQSPNIQIDSKSQASFPPSAKVNEDPIQLTKSMVQSMNEYEWLSQFSTMYDFILEPKYLSPNSKSMNNVSIYSKQAGDMFALGCILAQLYFPGRTPLFTKRSLNIYISSAITLATKRENKKCTSSEIMELLPNLKMLPHPIFECVCGLLQPFPLNRFTAFDLISCYYKQDSLPHTHVPSRDISFSILPLFPISFKNVHTFLGQLNLADTWKEKIHVTQIHIQSLCELPIDSFLLVLMSILQFFKSTDKETRRSALSFIDQLGVKLGADGAKLYILPVLLKLFDIGSAEEDELLLLSLLSPSMLFVFLKTFEAPIFISSILPFVFEYLYITSTTRKIRAVTSEALSRLAQTDALGPAVTTRYLLPPLLKQLGFTKHMSSWSSPSIQKQSMKSQSFSTENVLDLIPDISYSRQYLLSALSGVCQWIPQEALRVFVFPRVFELLRDTLGYPSSHNALTPSNESTVHDLITFVTDILPFLSDSTLSNTLIDVQLPNFQYLLQIIDLPLGKINGLSPPSTPPASEKEDDIGKYQLDLVRLLVAICYRIGPSASMTHILPSVEIFFNNFIASYAELPIGSLATEFAIILARSLYIPLANLLTLPEMKAQVPCVREKLLDIIYLDDGKDLNRDHSNSLSISASSSDFHASKNYEVDEEEEEGDEEEDKGNLEEVKHFQRELENEETEGEKKLISDETEEIENEDDDSASIEYTESSSPLLHANLSVNLNSDKGFGKLTIWDDSPPVDLALLEEEKPLAEDSHALLLDEKEIIKKSLLEGPFKHRASAPIISSPLAKRQSNVGLLSPSGPNTNLPYLRRNSLGISGSSVSNTIWMCGAGYNSNRSFSKNNSIWNLQRMNVQHSFLGHDSCVTAIAHDSGENILLTGCSTSNIAIWSLSKSPVYRSSMYQEHHESIFGINLLKGGKYAVSCDSSSLHVWHSERGTQLLKYPTCSHSQFVAMQPSYLHSTFFEGYNFYNTGSIVLGTSNGTLATVDLRDSSAKLISEWNVSCEENTSFGLLRTISISHNYNLVASGSHNGSISILDQRTGCILICWKAHESEIIKVLFCEDHNLISVCADRSAVIWDVSKFIYCKVGNRLLPRALKKISHLPEGMNSNTITIQTVDDSKALLIGGGNNVGVSCFTENENAQQLKFSLGSISTANSVGKARLSIHSLSFLRLRRLLIIGSDDGQVKCISEDFN